MDSRWENKLVVISFGDEIKLDVREEGGRKSEKEINDHTGCGNVGSQP